MQYKLQYTHASEATVRTGSEADQKKSLHMTKTGRLNGCQLAKLYLRCPRYPKHLKKHDPNIIWDCPLETWIFGAILAAVGLLVIGCSLGHSELGFPFAATGVISSGAGSFIFVTRFRAWIKSLL